MCWRPSTRRSPTASGCSGSSRRRCRCWGGTRRTRFSSTASSSCGATYRYRSFCSVAVGCFCWELLLAGVMVCRRDCDCRWRLWFRCTVLDWMCRTQRRVAVPLWLLDPESGWCWFFPWLLGSVLCTCIFFLCVAAAGNVRRSSRALALTPIKIKDTFTAYNL